MHPLHMQKKKKGATEHCGHMSFIFMFQPFLGKTFCMSSGEHPPDSSSLGFVIDDWHHCAELFAHGRMGSMLKMT